MDEMKIRTKFLKSIINSIIKKQIKKSLGIDVCFSLDDLNITYTNGEAKIHLSADVSMKQDSVLALVKNLELL